MALPLPLPAAIAIAIALRIRRARCTMAPHPAPHVELMHEALHGRTATHDAQCPCHGGSCTAVQHCGTRVRVRSCKTPPCPRSVSAYAQRSCATAFYNWQRLQCWRAAWSNCKCLCRGDAVDGQGICGTAIDVRRPGLAAVVRACPHSKQNTPGATTHHAPRPLGARTIAGGPEVVAACCHSV